MYKMNENFAAWDSETFFLFPFSLHILALIFSSSRKAGRAKLSVPAENERKSGVGGRGAKGVRLLLTFLCIRWWKDDDALIPFAL
jgi:hypothetical protein